MLVAATPPGRVDVHRFCTHRPGPEEIAMIPMPRTWLAALLAQQLCASAALAAPAPGERFIVDGRCVTVTEVDAGQVSYEWSEGNANGWGTLDAGSLGPRCRVDARPPAAGARPRVERPADAGERAAMPNTPAGDDAFAQQILKAHNRFRCLHGAPPLQWSDAVADYAQRWVARAGFKHSDSYNSPIGQMGENLYGSSGALSGEEATAAWYSESEGYDYGREGSSSSGHFTAMIWKDAKFMGCGRARGTLSCNYWAGPAADSCAVPNMGGCYTKQVRPVSRDRQACR